MQKPRVTEIQVRMDCNGCVQKIKKTLHGINGIYDLYIDFPQQKITIVGCADPEKIVKAIKKTRKTAIICAHIEPPDEPAEQPSEPANQGDAPTPESPNSPPTEPQLIEGAPPAEARKDKKPEAKPSPDAAESLGSHLVQHTGPKDVEEVHLIYHHPPDYGYRYGYNPNIGHGYSEQWHSYSGGPGFRHEPFYPSSQGIRYEPSYPGGSGFRHEPSYPRVLGLRNEPSYTDGPGFRHEQPPPPPPGSGFRQEQTPSPGPSFRHDPSPPPGPGFRHKQTPPPGPSFRHEQTPPPGQGFRHEQTPPPSQNHHVTHSYNTHMTTPYVTGYEYIRPPPMYTHYNQMERYNEDYYHQRNNANGNVTAIFSDENPNSCTIV